MAIYLNFFKDEIDELRRRAFEERGVAVLPAPWKKKEKKFGEFRSGSIAVWPIPYPECQAFFPSSPRCDKKLWKHVFGINIPERILPFVVSIDFILYISCDQNMSPKYECISWENTSVDSNSVENNNALWYKVDYTYIWHLECYTNFVEKQKLYCLPLKTLFITFPPKRFLETFFARNMIVKLKMLMMKK